jgi:mRNA-degrading endonuclease RelE of RelBE toxin-antitoxin system
MVAGREREFRISKKAEKFIRSLPEKERKSVKESIRKLINRETQGLDIKRYLPYPNEFRLRVGRIRILFKSTKELLFIFKADFRGGVYK